MTESKLADLLEEAFVRCRNLEVPLADRLRAFANELRCIGPHFQAAVDALVSRLAESNAGATAPKVGEPMPALLLPDEQAASSGLFALNREISVCAGLRGGVGRTRTSNQTIISH